MEQQLTGILQELKYRYKNRWTQIWAKLEPEYKKIQETLEKGETPDEEHLKKLKELSEHTFSRKLSVKQLKNKKLKEFLAKVKNWTDIDELSKEEIWKVKGLGATAITHWATLVNSHLFLPMWKNTMKRTTKILKLPSRFYASSNHPKQVENTLKFLKTIGEQLKIENMLETAYYLNKLEKTKLAAKHWQKISHRRQRKPLVEIKKYQIKRKRRQKW